MPRTVTPGNWVCVLPPPGLERQEEGCWPYIRGRPCMVKWATLKHHPRHHPHLDYRNFRFQPEAANERVGHPTQTHTERDTRGTQPFTEWENEWGKERSGSFTDLEQALPKSPTLFSRWLHFPNRLNVRVKENCLLASYSGEISFNSFGNKRQCLCECKEKPNPTYKYGHLSWAMRLSSWKA